MNAISRSQERIVAERRLASLTRALGPAMQAALADDAVVEVLINCDGQMRVDRVGHGIETTDTRLSVAERETAIRLLAAEAFETVTEDHPFLAATLPGSGARVQALIAPIVRAPVLAIRKRPKLIYTLDDYVRTGVASPAQAAKLRQAILTRRNIVVAGGTGCSCTLTLAP